LFCTAVLLVIVDCTRYRYLLYFVMQLSCIWAISIAALHYVNTTVSKRIVNAITKIHSHAHIMFSSVVKFLCSRQNIWQY